MGASDLLADPVLASVPVCRGYKVLGGVVLYQKLGQGGMGAVYRGRHLRLDIDVAVKVMSLPTGLTPEQSDNFTRRFLREAKTAASITHQNLVGVIDVNTEAGIYFLVMDYVEGESAADRLKRKGALSEQESLSHKPPKTCLTDRTRYSMNTLGGWRRMVTWPPTSSTATPSRRS